MWKDSFFQKTTLFDVGLIVQMGHQGRDCCHPSLLPETLVAIDFSGIQKVRVRWCHCHHFGRSKAHVRTQLLRFGWFPGSVEDPRTIVTFQTLSFFHLLTLQSKITCTDYWLRRVLYTVYSIVWELGVPSRCSALVS